MSAVGFGTVWIFHSGLLEATMAQRSRGIEDFGKEYAGEELQGYLPDLHFMVSF